MRKDDDLLTEPELDLRGDAGHGDHGEMGGSYPIPLSLPCCPFAREGLGSRLMLSCPGYGPETVSFVGLGAGESLGERVSCRHLSTQRGARGYVSACRHPGGLPAEAARLAARSRRPRGVAAN